MESDKLDTLAELQLFLTRRQSAAEARLEQLLFDGTRQYQLGNLDPAASHFTEVLSIDDGNDDALRHLRLISDLRDPTPVAEPRILWRCWRQGLWELDWLRVLMGDQYWSAELDESAPRTGRRIIICVDDKSDETVEEFYRASFLAGDRIFLIHLGDGHMEKSYEAYRWCAKIWRTHWAPRLAQQTAVRFFPLGYKTGFQRDRPPLPIEARTLTWSFAGGAFKQSRPAMLEHMSSVENGFVHRTKEFGDPSGLSTDDYRDLMERSIYIPSPRGDWSVDCFRVYEALEAGCIPIVEERRNFAYFTAMHGPHPMPVIHDWSEAPALIAAIRAAGGEERLRQACHAWWQAMNARLQQDFKTDLNRLAGPLY